MRHRRHPLQAPQRPGSFRSLTRCRRLSRNPPRSVPLRPSPPATRLREALELRRAPFSSRVAPLPARVDARPLRLSRSRARAADLPSLSPCLLVQPRSSMPPVAPRPPSLATTRRIPSAVSRLSRSLGTKRSSTRTTTRLFALHFGPEARSSRAIRCSLDGAKVSDRGCLSSTTSSPSARVRR